MVALLAGVLAQTTPIETASEVATADQSVIHLILHANIVVQLTLLLLVGFSVVSWAIIGSKHRQLKHMKRSAEKFYRAFWQARSIDDLIAKGSFRQSPPFIVFKSTLDTLRDAPKQNAQSMVAREAQRKVDSEIQQMEYGVPFLATTGSAAPFVGLFGTVWGILNAFWQIGKTGATSLAVVGPHIAEALIATAIGLAAAIPAVIFYNVYVNRIRLMAKDLQDFSSDLVARIDREYFQS